jgi:RDD family
MDSDASSIDATTGLRRAGFWRRWLAILIDGIVVMIPFQILAAILFSATAGMIQMDRGFFSSCINGTTIPQGLDPPPPRDSNAIRVCKISFFGALTGATLSVARVAHDGGSTTTVSQTYMLDKDGTPVHGRSIDWIYQLAFVGYLVAMIWTRGKTLGSRVVKVKVIDTANPSAAGVPLSKTIVRYLAMMIGAVPALALLIYQRIAVGGTADAMFTSSFFQWFGYAAVLGGLWALVLIIQVAMKRDPVYDRLAGTAVVRS